MDKKAIIFVRVSTEKQHLESQEEALKRNATADGFRTKDIEYIGKKESGYKLDEDERQGIEELYSLISKGNIDTVYIWELSRLSRRPKILYSIRDKLLQNRIQLKCLNPQFTLLNTDRSQFDNTANIIFSLFGALAEQEVIEKKARFARGKARLASQGKFSGGAIPFGYKVDYDKDKLIVINEEEAIIVRDIFNLYENGMSQAKIAKEYYARGNKRITISFVHQILTNKLLTGIETKGANASYARKYPPIISSQQFNKCRELAKQNNTTLSKARSIYFADRLIKCPVCGGHWTSTGSKVNYHCYDAYNINKRYNGYDNMPNCTNKSTMSINVLDSLLWHIAIRMEEEFILTSAQDKLESYKKQKNNIEDKLNQTQFLLDDIESRKQRLMEAYIDGLEASIYQKKKKQLRQEEEDIKTNAISYKDEIQHIDNMIANITESLNLNKTETIENHIDYVLSLIEQISKISNDKTRFDIIHRHIKEIVIENKTIKYQFANYKEPKNVFAKNIIIHPYIGKTLYYFYIPFGKTMLYCDDNNNIKGKVEMEYLKRFEDASKIRIKNKLKKEKLNQLEKRRSKGIMSLVEASKLTNISYSTLASATLRGKLPYIMENKTKLITKKDLDDYVKQRKNKNSIELISEENEATPPTS